MLRASSICEAAGVPTSSLISEGFVAQARPTSIGLGFPNIAIAVVPGHPGAQSIEELRKNITEHTLDEVIDNLLQAPASSMTVRESAAREIVCKGGFDEVNRYFIDNDLSDGLPIVPPTIEKIEAFLGYTDRKPEEVLGVLLPDSRAASIWSIAVNGVMAGCRPEYMPILVAIIEAMADPAYGVEHSGNTPGSDTLIILNGPITKELGFNYTQGVMRDGCLPNTSIGRFWRLYLRNVAGFLLHKTDKGTFGNTWRVVVPENEDAVKKIGWPNIAVEMGFGQDDNTVTIARYSGGNVIASISGATPEDILPNICDHLERQITWQVTFTVGQGLGTLRPLILLTPIIAETIAKAGWSKQMVKQYFYDHARIPAWKFERTLKVWMNKPVWDLEDEVRQGHIPKVYAESSDPNRMVPTVWRPEDYMIAVTGDELRTNAYVFAHNGLLGYPVGKKIKLPGDWSQRLAAR